MELEEYIEWFDNNNNLMNIIRYHYFCITFTRNATITVTLILTLDWLGQM